LLCQASFAALRLSISAIWRSMLSMNAARCASLKVSGERRVPRLGGGAGAESVMGFLSTLGAEPNPPGARRRAHFADVLQKRHLTRSGKEPKNEKEGPAAASGPSSLKLLAGEVQGAS
jgi:hypothetical protein